MAENYKPMSLVHSLAEEIKAFSQHQKERWQDHVAQITERQAQTDREWEQRQKAEAKERARRWRAGAPARKKYKAMKAKIAERKAFEMAVKNAQLLDVGNKIQMALALHNICCALRGMRGMESLLSLTAPPRR